MSRARRPVDWENDLARARSAEADLAARLAADPRLKFFEDHTHAHDRLDFTFLYQGLEVHLDLKEKRQRYSWEYASLWPEVASTDLFIVDETVYRRVVWQGGGGYLAIHDHPMGRWAIFGPWELTLGPRVRYQRWGQRTGRAFLKGKILLDLSSAASLSKDFSVDDLVGVIERSREGLEAVEAVPIEGHPIPEVGS